MASRDPKVILYSTSMRTWEVWQTGRLLGHGSLESCQKFYPEALPVDDHQKQLAAGDA